MSRTSSHNTSANLYQPAYLPSNSQNDYVTEQPEERHTPRSLRWQPKTDLVEKYKLIVPRDSKDSPYLQILEKSDISFDTPARVDLDIPPSTSKGSTTCPWPGECSRNGDPFTRPADCYRHIKNVHGPVEDRDKFPCSYDPCLNGRHLDENAFTRKDHYRDHLRDYHQEDIGAAKGEKSARTEKEKREWMKEQKKWLATRKISPNHWRCAKCLAKKSVARHGWHCSSCNQQCEQDRIEARMKLSPKEELQPAIAMSEDTTMQLQYQTYDERCRVCYVGSGWIDNGLGEWDPCSSCNYQETQIGAQTFR